MDNFTDSISTVRKATRKVSNSLPKNKKSFASKNLVF